MKGRIVIYALLIYAFTGMTLHAQAQENWEETGEIEDAEVIIEKDRKIELPQVSRPFSKVPPLNDPKEPLPQNFDFNEYEYEGPAYQPTIALMKIKSVSSGATYPNYIKAGFGNYLSPLAQVSVSHQLDNLTTGLFFDHLSFARGPVDGANSGASDNHGNLFANYRGNSHTLDLNFDFSNRSRYHFGFSEGNRNDIDPTKQTYNLYGVDLGIKNRNTEYVDYELRAGFYHIDDRFTAKETAFTSQLSLRIPINPQWSILSETDLLLSQFEDVSDLNRNLVRSKGGVEFILDKLTIEGAATIVADNDTIDNTSDIRLYPHAKASYTIDERWTVNGGVTGTTDAVTLRTMAIENPFLANGIAPVHSNRQLDLFGGIKGQVIENLTTEFGFSYSRIENLYSYGDTLRFMPLYDTGKTGVSSVFGRLAYDLNNKGSVSAFLKYQNFNPDALPEVFHRPQFVARISGQYRIIDKLQGGLNLSILSGIKAFEPQIQENITLDSIVDIGVDFTYSINANFEAFVQLNNVIGRTYERYLNYLNRGFMSHFGVIYSF